MRAKAAVMHEVKKPLAVEDVDVMEPGAHEVLVRWVANGVCHSDLHVMTGDYPHPLPVVLGHEGAGIVEEVGPGVTYAKPGDHVIRLTASSKSVASSSYTMSVDKFLLYPR